jgi:tRNA G10  N-methylase Trm11
MQYAFHLGHNQALSKAELFALFQMYEISVEKARQVGEWYIIHTSKKIDIQSLMERLGGITRIGETIGLLRTAQEVEVAKVIHEIVEDGKIVFGISGQSTRFGIAVKKQLKQLGRSARYVEIKNSASLLHNNLLDDGVHLDLIDNQYYQTIALHGFEKMAERDFDRPAFDDKSGMLPPKLARIMINLAQVSVTDVLLDPFCGSGTVLMEAATFGIEHLYGSDISDKAVKDTKENLNWLQERISANLHITIQKADAQLLSNVFDSASINAIVTEPYMGIPKRGNERKDTLEREAKELLKLYTEALISFARVLKPQGRIVFSKPRFRCEDRWIEIDWNSAVQKAGFDVVPLSDDQPFIVYARDTQHVGREIWKLIKK